MIYFWIILNINIIKTLFFILILTVFLVINDILFFLKINKLMDDSIYFNLLYIYMIQTNNNIVNTMHFLYRKKNYIIN